MSCSRTFVAVICGVAVGILGVEGWWGFLPMLLTQLLVRRSEAPRSCRPGLFHALAYGPLPADAECPPLPNTRPQTLTHPCTVCTRHALEGRHITPKILPLLVGPRLLRCVAAAPLPPLELGLACSSLVRPCVATPHPCCSIVPLHLCRSQPVSLNSSSTH